MRYLTFIMTLILLTACTSPTAPAASNSDNAPAPVGPSQPVAGANPSRDAAEAGPILYDNIPLETYTHPGQQFSIQYPANWQPFDQADGVVFVDPTDRAGYSVHFSPVETDMTPDKLATFARQFVENNFGDQAGFAILEQEGDSLRFKGTDANFGPAINQLTLVPADDLIYLTLVTVVEDQWEAAAADLQALTDSLVLQPVAAAALTPLPDVPPSWTFYAHPTEQFAFLYPDDWNLSANDQSVQATLPSANFAFSVEVIAKPGAGTDPTLAATFTQETADQLAAQYDNFQALPLTTYQAEGGQGYTIDYLYTDSEDGPTAGSIIVTGVEDKLYLIQITAPALAYEGALAWFNPMLQSFRLVPDDFETPPPP